MVGLNFTDEASEVEQREQAWSDFLDRPTDSEADSLEVEKIAFHAGFRAGVATHNTVSREQIAEAIRLAGSPYWKPLSGARSIVAAGAVLALLVPTSKPESPFRANPPTPPDEQLEEWFWLAAPKSLVHGSLPPTAFPGLRSIWRNGCDTGMVAQ